MLTLYQKRYQRVKPSWTLLLTFYQTPTCLCLPLLLILYQTNPQPSYQTPYALPTPNLSIVSVTHKHTMFLPFTRPSPNLFYCLKHSHKSHCRSFTKHNMSLTHKYPPTLYIMLQTLCQTKHQLIYCICYTQFWKPFTRHCSTSLLYQTLTHNTDDPLPEPYFSLVYASVPYKQCCPPFATTRLSFHSSINIHTHNVADPLPETD